MLKTVTNKKKVELGNYKWDLIVILILDILLAY
jgi:hypothetical protein